MYHDAKQYNRRTEEEKEGAEEQQFSESGAGQGQAATPGKRIVFGAEPVATNVAIKFQIAGIKDVVRTVEAMALAELSHAANVAGTEAAQPGPTPAAPGAFQGETEAAARLNAGDGRAWPRRRNRGGGRGHTQ